MRFLFPGILAILGLLILEVSAADPGMRTPPARFTLSSAAAPAGSGPVRVVQAGHPGSEGGYYAALARDLLLARSHPDFPSGIAGRADAPDVDDEALTAVVRRLCVACHNDQLLTGNLSLQGFDVGAAAGAAETTEKMITKLRLGMMPPPGIPRPGGDTLLTLVETLERKVDDAVRDNPDPGLRPLQRLNRVEYQRTVRQLLDLEIDAAAFLPPETISDGFDNIADVQGVSPTVLDGYMRAASHIAHMAVGDVDATPRQATYKAPRTTSQMERVEGAPFGSRGGISVVHNFPADGQYAFRLEFHPEPTGFLYGQTSRGEQIEVSINGERAALLDVDRWISEADADGIAMRTDPIFIRAGPQRVSAVFVPTFDAPVNDLLSPVGQTMADTRIGLALGVTTVPHLRDLIITGPTETTGVSETPSRARIFSCRPTSPEDESVCAEQIIGRVGTEAYRRPLTRHDVEGLLSLYREGAREGGFEIGIRTALYGILASPHFIFRFEPLPDGADPTRPQPLEGTSIATRLSYFLWASPPDAILLELAADGSLGDPAVLEAQALRMLADPRSEALARRFAGQWLKLQRLDVIHPDPRRHPEFDDRLRESMRRETELLFHSLVREDRSFLDLLRADYTFVDERLARHYGIQGVSGSEFRRVPVTDERRQGLLGHASILTLTSHANRTSPVDRGLWVMEVLLGTEPPPPPPNVPDLDVTDSEDPDSGRSLTVRERMEMHRSSPTCNACHQFIDPLGLPLESFDVTGLWRIRDEGNPLDPRGELWDGTVLASPMDLRRALLEREVPVVRNFTENLMRYALGRRLQHEDKPTARRIAREARDEDYRLSSFILGVVSSDAFRMRGAEVVARTDEDDS